MEKGIEGNMEKVISVLNTPIDISRVLKKAKELQSSINEQMNQFEKENKGVNCLLTLNQGVLNIDLSVDYGLYLDNINSIAQEPS